MVSDVKTPWDVCTFVCPQQFTCCSYRGTAPWPDSWCFRTWSYKQLYCLLVILVLYSFHRLATKILLYTIQPFACVTGISGLVNESTSVWCGCQSGCEVMASIDITSVTIGFCIHPFWCLFLVADAHEKDEHQGRDCFWLQKVGETDKLSTPQVKIRMWN